MIAHCFDFRILLLVLVSHQTRGHTTVGHLPWRPWRIVYRLCATGYNYAPARARVTESKLSKIRV